MAKYKLASIPNIADEYILLLLLRTHLKNNKTFHIM